MGRSHLRAFQVGAGAGAWGPRVHGGACGWEGPLERVSLGSKASPKSLKLSALCPASPASPLSGLSRGGNDSGSEALTLAPGRGAPHPASEHAGVLLEREGPCGGASTAAAVMYRMLTVPSAGSGRVSIPVL